MPDAVELMKTIKRAALDAVKASKPVEVCFGKVTSASPLKILVEQKLPLGEGQLILTRNVTNFKTYITGGNVKNFYYTVTSRFFARGNSPGCAFPCSRYRKGSNHRT